MARTTNGTASTTVKRLLALERGQRDLTTEVRAMRALNTGLAGC